jgi:hypothetical protein
MPWECDVVTAIEHAYTIDVAMHDDRLLGAVLGNTASWSTWIAVLKAAFGLGLTDEQRTLFASVAGQRLAPHHRVRELWCLCGRRAGKSRIAALVAVYIALFAPVKLAPGERGVVLVLANGIDQAGLVFSYAKAFITESPVLRREIVSITKSEVRLRNGITIAVHANSFRSVRGWTLLACVFDEVSFWRDESSAQPDVETYTACLPSLLTTNGMLIGISTGYRRTGLLYSKYRDHFGENSQDVLVVQGTSRIFNPTLSEAGIAAMRAADPTAHASEWDAEFRSDLSAFLDDELVERAVDYDRPPELPSMIDTSYIAFTDAAGGTGNDAYAIAIGHKQGENFVIDAVRGTRSGVRFDPAIVTEEYAALLKYYRIYSVTGDHYAAAWVSSAWTRHGITYKQSDLTKSEIYLECAPLFARGLVRLPNYPKLLRELRLLERHVHRSGRDSVDHGRNGHDDHANVACGVLQLLSDKNYFDLEMWRRAWE